jgi:N-acyl-D-aspartate/D-glutamate deacylase
MNVDSDHTIVVGGAGFKARQVRGDRHRYFADPDFRRELGAIQGPFVAALAQGWDRLVLRMSGSERTTRFQDRSVVEIAAERGTSVLDAFCDTVLDDDLEGQWGALMMNFDEDAVAAKMRLAVGRGESVSVLFSLRDT